MHKKRILAGIAGVAAFGMVLTGCSSNGGGNESADGSYNLVLGHAGSVDDPRHWAGERFAELIEERTDGQVTVEVHPDATLGTWEEMIDGMQIGSTDIVIESILSLEAYTELAAVETAPFLYEDEEQFFAVWDGELGEEIKQAITDESGYAMLGNMYRSARQLNTKQPVTQLSDVQGMTLRTPSAQTMMDTWNALGARAESLPINEVYSALESGVLDGQENPLDTILFTRLHEVATNVTETSHMYANYHFLMWNNSLESYPDEIRSAIEEVAAQVGEEYTQNTIDNTEQYRADLEAEGTTFHELTDRDDWVAAVEPVHASLPEQVQAWIEQIRAH